jgi:hypothetical protein
MQLGFEARGTAGGNVTIRYDNGKEVAVTGGGGGDAVDALAAEAYRAKHPNGEVTARGTVTTSVEVE